MTEHFYRSPELALRIIQLTELERDALAAEPPTEHSFIVERIDDAASRHTETPA